MSTERPHPDEYAPFYREYVGRLGDGAIVPRLASQPGEMRELLDGLRPGGAAHRYAEGKWTVKEVVGHLADAERILGMRATCFARAETAELPGFDEETYVAEGGFAGRTVDSLLREFEQLRGANVEMFGGLAGDIWKRTGTANGSAVSVRALAWILAGHVDHHVEVLRERYSRAFARA